MHFEENQLYPSSIGISPLSTVHPPRFQPGSVRASTRSYPRFTLTMDRSLGFGSTPCDYHHHYGGHALFRLAFATATGVNPLTSPHGSNSPAHSTKGTQSGIPTRGIALSRLVSTRFQVLLTPRLGCFSPFPQVLVHYRSPRVFRLGRWSAQIPTEFHVFRGTWELSKEVVCLSRTGLSPSAAGFSNAVRLDNDFVTPCPLGRRNAEVPRPRDGNACRLSRRLGLASPLFARHY